MIWKSVTLFEERINQWKRASKVKQRANALKKKKSNKIERRVGKINGRARMQRITG